MAADSSSSSIRGFRYDVFLSFRGPDTRKNFVGHLHTALKHRQVSAFIDTEDLEKGQEILKLFKAIEDSRLSVVVFSKNYASSTWCLRELAKMMECKHTRNQIVVPIFYQVDPAHVRYHKKEGSFKDALDEHKHKGRETTAELERWMSALTMAADIYEGDSSKSDSIHNAAVAKHHGGSETTEEMKSTLKAAANISGWDSRKYEDDAVLIKLVVDDIVEKLLETRSSESESNGYLVGINNHIAEMESRLKNGHVVGIWGMGGLGKTTIATAVYDKVTSNFDARYFLKDLKTKRPEQIQEELLVQMLGRKVWNLSSPQMASLIIEKLNERKIFLVLDDVDKLAQIEAVLGKSQTFDGGSRIIITTRNEELLKKYVIYNPKSLNDEEALHLFKKHAEPSEEHNHLLSQFVSYAKGLPLAIEVLGRSLQKLSKRDWEIELENLKTGQNQEIGDVLMTSYNGLDDSEKKIFRDVACFFKGIRKDYATLILDACELSPQRGLGVLARRALVTTSGYDFPVLAIHDLLQDMALAIVRKNSSRPSRLTIADNVEDVLSKKTKEVESIDIDLFNSEEVEIDVQAFKKMTELRLLRIHYNRSVDSVDDSYRSSSDELYHLRGKCKQTVTGQLKSLSRQLRCLIWHGCPLKSLPSEFKPLHLVDLDMRCSDIEQLWEGEQETKPLEKLKFINLSRSQNLKKIPDLKKATQLEKINLEGCTSLSELHPSISECKNLVFLGLKGCTKLKILPRYFRMKSLKTLELSGCSNLENFPEILEVMEELRELCLDETAIKKLPPSIINIRELLKLSLKNCSELESLPPSICQMKSLKYVILSGCSKLQVFPEIAGIKDMERLIELHLDGTSLEQFLPSISALKTLAVFNLRGCKELKNLPRSIEMVSLESLILSGCSKLKNFPEIAVAMDRLTELHLEDTAVEELPLSIKELHQLKSLSLRGCGEIKSLPSSIFSLKCLEEVIVSGCSKFEAFPDIVEDVHCEKLVTLRLEYCRELKGLPTRFCLLKSLTFVTLSGCSKFEVFPEIFDDMEELRELHLDGTCIRKLVPSIDRMKRLVLLSMRNCTSLVFLPWISIRKLSHLKRLILSGCSNLHVLPEDLRTLNPVLDVEVEGSCVQQTSSMPSSPTMFLVGRDRHITEMKKLMYPPDQVADVIRIVGICGTSGMGKSAIARALYEEFSPNFERHCFLEDVKEGFKRHGADFMQEKLLPSLKQKVENVDCLKMKKVLLVLDDVDDQTQIETILAMSSSFGGGSRIIVTAKTTEILDRFDGTYQPQLHSNEDFVLLKHYAYRSMEPSTEYDPLLRRLAKYAKGLPLALKVLGLLLSNRGELQWESTFLEEIKLNHHMGAKILFDLSFDDLNASEKEIFLDVACFFKGMKKEHATEILHNCGFFPHSGLGVLIDRSLIAVSQDGYLKMHDPILEVGIEKSRLESVHGPGERTRLWSSDGIECLSDAEMVTDKVEAINLDLSNSAHVRFLVQALEKMDKLRLLQIVDSSRGCKQHVIGDFKFLSHNLRCLIWHGYPLKSLPFNFRPQNLFDLEMPFSKLEILWEGTKLLNNLKSVNLSYNSNLTIVPDLTKATNLEKLILDGCTSLVEVHQSIWDHKTLLFLSLKGCRKLERLPASIQMSSLKCFNLSGCANLKKIPEIAGVMKELSEIDLDETAIETLPLTIDRVLGLESLCMRNCKSLVYLPDSLCNLAYLQQLYLDGCSKLTKLPKNLRNTESLKISGIEELSLIMNEGVIGVSGKGTSTKSGSGEGRVYIPRLSMAPKRYRQRKQEDDNKGANRVGLSQLLDEE